jgi:hypothetical protein
MRAGSIARTLMLLHSVVCLLALPALPSRPHYFSRARSATRQDINGAMPRSDASSAVPVSDASQRSIEADKEQLFDAYNMLHSLAQDFKKPFDSPAVLVVGHQTSGKSALLEALMGFQFNQVQMRFGAEYDILIAALQYRWAEERRHDVLWH